jgi:hypothetical protein
MILVWWKLEEPQHDDDNLKQSIWIKLKRIDFMGAFFMSVAILSCISAFDLGSKNASSTVIVILAVLGVATAVLFALTERFWAREPMFPLELLGKHAVVTSYSIIFIQTGIQVAVSQGVHFLCFLFSLISSVQQY